MVKTIRSWSFCIAFRNKTCVLRFSNPRVSILQATLCSDTILWRPTFGLRWNTCVMCYSLDQW
jgi:hypothetical protein